MPFYCNFERVLSDVSRAREVPYRGKSTPVPGTLGTVPDFKFTGWLAGVREVMKEDLKLFSRVLFNPKHPNLLETDVD